MRALVMRALLALSLLVAGPTCAQSIDPSAIDALGIAISKPSAAPSSAIPGAQYVPFVGDSLIQGAGGAGTTIASVYAALSGATTTNAGVGGQTSTQIAKRMGAIATTLTFSGNNVGPFGARNTVTAIDGATPAAATGLLSTPADTTNRELTGTVTCATTNIHGTLTRYGANETYYFRGDATTGGNTCGPNAVFVPDFNWGVRPLFFEMGRNDPVLATVQANVAAVFAKCAAAGNSQCYWLDILTGPNEGASAGDSGHGLYVTITGINSTIAALYPGRVIAWRGWLVSQYNPASSPDVAAHADDQVPPSMQLGDGSVHLLGTGYASGAAYAYSQTSAVYALRARTGLTIDNLNAVLNRPLSISGSLAIGCGVAAATDGIDLCGNMRLASGKAIIGTDLGGNVITLLNWVGTSSNLLIGLSNLQALSIGNNYGQINFATSGAPQFQRGSQDISYSYQAPAAAATVTMADTSDVAIVDPAGTLASLTIKLPTCSASYDGKNARFLMTQAVTTLTVTSTAGTVLGAPSAAGASSTLGWWCRGSNTSWYRAQ